MKDKRRRRIPPAKARAAIVGGLYSGSHPETWCGKCGALRRTVDDSGACGYCRAVAIVRRPVEIERAKREIKAGESQTP
jgi:hypothetical protein